MTPRPQRRVASRFSERQEWLLVTVMLQGVCVFRQYTAFIGMVHGQKTNLVAKLVGRGLAIACPCPSPARTGLPPRSSAL